MSITPFQASLWIELLAAGFGGLHGALFAAGAKQHRIDVLGVPPTAPVRGDIQ